MLRARVCSVPRQLMKMSSTAQSSRPKSTTARRDVNIKVAIFDIDGTLIDSNDAHARAFETAFRENAKKVFPFQDIRRLIGMGSDKLIPTLSGIGPESEIGKRIASEKKEYFAKYEMPFVKPFPKVKELAQTLVDRKIQIAIASSAKSSELDEFLKKLDITELVSSSSTSDDVEHSKRDADVMHAVLDKLGDAISPEETIMIGDTPFDIEAAKKAGVETIVFRCGGYWSDEDLKGAIAIYDSPADLLARLDESPFASRNRQT